MPPKMIPQVVIYRASPKAALDRPVSLHKYLISHLSILSFLATIASFLPLLLFLICFPRSTASFQATMRSLPCPDINEDEPVYTCKRPKCQRRGNRNFFLNKSTNMLTTTCGFCRRSTRSEWDHLRVEVCCVLGKAWRSPTKPRVAHCSLVMLGAARRYEMY
jgi:hypothetical protein